MTGSEVMASSFARILTSAKKYIWAIQMREKGLVPINASILQVASNAVVTQEW